MKWVPCHKCADYALVDDEDEPTPGAMKIRVPRDAHVIREDDDDKDFAKSERRAQAAIARGEKDALPLFIVNCFANNRVIPKWAQEEFLAAHRKVYGYEVDSWDEVFGRPLKKGMQRAAARRKTRLARPIVDRVHERIDAGEPMDFDSIGKEFGVSRTVAAEIYYDFWKEFFKEDAREIDEGSSD